MLSFTIYGNSAHAQLTKSLGVKITSPAQGQQIPVGIKNLPILGISSYNSTMNCQVSLIVNDVKPYQKAAGHSSAADYSSWNYILTPHYTSIKQGTNKLTAKLSCHDNSMNVTKFYSINITGVTSSTQASKSSVVTPIVLEPMKQLPNRLSVNGILAKTGILAATHQQSAPQSNTNSTTVQSEKHHRHAPTATTGKTGNPATVSGEAHPKKHHQEKTATPTTAAISNNRVPVSNNRVAISTTSDGTIDKVTIPPAINGTVDKVAIPKQAAAALALNKTVGQEQQSNVTTPFAFAPPSSLSPSSGFNNNHQSLQLPPIANPGPGQSVIAGSNVILNGSSSRAPGGIILSYSWRQIPTSATIALSGVSTPVWEFTAPNVSANTLLRFQLNVTDNLGQTGTAIVNILDKPGSTFNAPTRIQIIKSPYATASIPPIKLNKGLNSASIPTNHAPIPTPLTPPITNNAPIPPPLIPPINSRLSAQANNGAQPPFHNYPPIANAGHDQVVNAKSTIVLVGSLSRDPNGDSISYHWTQISGSQPITLGGANTPVWEFIAPNVASDTKLTFQLTVIDSHGLSDSGRVNVLVLAPTR